MGHTTQRKVMLLGIGTHPESSKRTSWMGTYTHPKTQKDGYRYPSPFAPKDGYINPSFLLQKLGMHTHLFEQMFATMNPSIPSECGITVLVYPVFFGLPPLGKVVSSQSKLCVGLSDPVGESRNIFWEEGDGYTSTVISNFCVVLCYN